MKSFSKIRIRLTLLYTTVLAMLSVLTAIFLYSAIYFQFERTDSESLRISTMQLASAYDLLNRNYSDTTNYDSIINSLKENDTYYRIYNDKFEVVKESEYMPLNDQEGFYLIQKFFNTNNDSGEITRFRLGTSSYRVCTDGYVTNDGQLIVTQLAENITEQLAFFRDPLLIVIFIIFVGIIASIFLGNLLAKKALEPIKRSYDQQRNFLADASHELRTPVAVVLANLEAVRANKEKTVESQQEWINNAYFEIKRTKSVVEDLLFLAKADAGESVGSFEPVDLSYLILEISEALSQLAEKKDISLITDISDIELFVLGNKNRLTELFTILIDNAIKYTDSGGEINISVENTDIDIIVKISDTGIGISKEDQPKIFDRFFRVDKARSRKESGTGLGLSIAKLIMDEHKINMKLESEEGEGTTFILTFKRYNIVSEN